MLKLAELKVGNFLKDREGRICKVEKIDAKEHSLSAPATDVPLQQKFSITF